MKYKVNFQALSKKAKVEYIWEYYRWHIIGILCGITIIVSAVFRVVTYKEPLLSVIMLNSYNSMTDTTGEEFEEFFQEYGYESYEGATDIKNVLYFSANEESNQIDYQDYEILLALLIGGDYDVFLGTGDEYLSFMDDGFLADLSEVFSDEFLQKYKEQIIYSNNMSESAGYPAAFSLKNNQWLSKNNYYNRECYLGILNKDNISEIAIDFSEFLLKCER